MYYFCWNTTNITHYLILKNKITLSSGFASNFHCLLTKLNKKSCFKPVFIPDPLGETLLVHAKSWTKNLKKYDHTFFLIRQSQWQRKSQIVVYIDRSMFFYFTIMIYSFYIILRFFLVYLKDFRRTTGKIRETRFLYRGASNSDIVRRISICDSWSFEGRYRSNFVVTLHTRWTTIRFNRQVWYRHLWFLFVHRRLFPYSASCNILCFHWESRFVFVFAFQQTKPARARYSNICGHLYASRINGENRLTVFCNVRFKVTNFLYKLVSLL